MANFPPWVFRVLYKLINRFDKQKQVIFMNYGYSHPEEKVNLDHDDEKNRYSIQLYHHLIENVNLSDKIIVEIGCGRGGGLAYIAKKFHPASLIGIDIEKSAINFANLQFNYDNLFFKTGNAEKVPLPDKSCDIVLNIESSHRYLTINRFVDEVKRILRPDGNFLFADFRYPHEWHDLISLIKSAGMRAVMEKDITANILLALQKDNTRRLTLVKASTPKILHKGITNFAGCLGSETYNYFLTRKLTYKSFVFRNAK
jgi:ubiquinone/menaquinone biosynthesis C-methylase UbiE